MTEDDKGSEINDEEEVFEVEQLNSMILPIVGPGWKRCNVSVSTIRNGKETFEQC